MVNQNELEEGEAHGRSFFLGDTNIDPHVAFPYIDRRLQAVLGHFQKEFEGGVSADELGAKYGGYGSFLPTEERSPSVLLQPRVQATPLNSNATRPARELKMEQIEPAKLNTASTKLKHKHSSKSLKRVRNSAIYWELGLQNSLTSSSESSPIDSQRCWLEDDAMSKQSPMTTIKMMTEYNIPGGSLLSPIQECPLNFLEVFKKKRGIVKLGKRKIIDNLEASFSGKGKLYLVKESRHQNQKAMSFNEDQRRYPRVDKQRETDSVRVSTNNSNIAPMPFLKDSAQGPRGSGSFANGCSITQQNAFAKHSNEDKLDSQKRVKKINSDGEDTCETKSHQNMHVERCDDYMHVRKDVDVMSTSSFSNSGNTVLREATGLKHVVDRLRNGEGSTMEFTSLYFAAALKYLLVASIFEANKSDTMKSGQLSYAMKIYTHTTQLFKYCAFQFEQLRNMVATALAYKCMAVAYMRVVRSKTTFFKRDPVDLESLLHSALIGNLSNAHIRARLQYVNDVIAGMDAFSKSEKAFAVAIKEAHESKRSEQIPSMKMIIDFSFEDIDSFLQLARHAMETLHH